jgi:hypothetical protein
MRDLRFVVQIGFAGAKPVEWAVVAACPEQEAYVRQGGETGTCHRSNRKHVLPIAFHCLGRPGDEPSLAVGPLAAEFADLTFALAGQDQQFDDAGQLRVQIVAGMAGSPGGGQLIVGQHAFARNFFDRLRDIVERVAIDDATPSQSSKNRACRREGGGTFGRRGQQLVDDVGEIGGACTAPGFPEAVLVESYAAIPVISSWA